MKENPKVFIGIKELGGYYSNLKNGFDSCHVHSVMLNIETNPFQYTYWFQHNPLWANWANTFSNKILPAFYYSSGFFRIIWDLVIARIYRFILFTVVLFQYDVFIFSYGTTFFNLKELPLLKYLGKKIILVFHGSDLRPIFMDGGALLQFNKTKNEIIFNIQKQKKRIAFMEKYSDYIITIPSIAQFLSKSFVNWWMVGIPFSSKKIRNTYKSKNKYLRILHAPSDKQVKGTIRIREIVESLKKKGYTFEYVELINKTNNEVLKELMRCDFVIDQLYSDTPMPILPTEAGYFGKPSVIGGYLESIQYQPFLPPTLYANPEKMEEIVTKLIINHQYRKRVGLKAKKFVKSRWNPSRVAQRYLRIIKGKIPKVWICRPDKIDYFKGAGLPEWKLKKVIRYVVKKGGMESLQLWDKPTLEKRFIKYCRKLS
jgi:glycosyltransferase involved in cell wall biosynthesis